MGSFPKSLCAHPNVYLVFRAELLELQMASYSNRQAVTLRVCPVTHVNVLTNQLYAENGSEATAV